MRRSWRGLGVASAPVAALVALACNAKAPAPEVHAIAIRAMQFDPAVLQVRVGDSIVWTNQDIVPHTATAAGTFDSQQLSTNQQWRYTVTRPGEVAYTCAFHPTMHGAIVAR